VRHLDLKSSSYTGWWLWLQTNIGLLQHYSLIIQLIRRDIAARYRGSVLGVAWSLVTPLLLLAVFTWTFGTVFPSRWPQAPGAPTDAPSTAEFALILFAGLIIFNLFSEVVNRAPGLILANPNYVKKVVFPLEILPVVAVGSALFNGGVSLVVLLGFMLVVLGNIPATSLLLALVVTPLALLTLGFAWLLASLGVYLRDISQVVGTATIALMFVTPIFYPATALPEWVGGWLILNPLSLPVGQARDVLIFGRLPDFAALAIYFMAALAIAVLGFTWFRKTRRGFADVL